MNDVFELHREEMENAATEAKERYAAEHPEAAGTSMKHDPLQHLQDGGECM